MKNLFKVLVISVMMMFLTNESFSQISPQLPPDECDTCPNEAIPIDGGLSWLLAAGGIYGVSKLRKNLKK